MWYKWDPTDRPWKKLLKVTDPLDRELFFCSTYIALGNGRDTPFWEARWLDGAAPKDLAPNLYLQAKIKKRTVRQEIQNDNWIRNLQNIDNPVMLQEFVLLFMAISNITLTEERDSIHWRWTSNGKYTVKSAYEVQFRGATVYFPAKEIWTARTEPKCRLFAWLALHNKVLTAENMIRKNWPCNPTCSLCYCLEETTVHLLTQCNYTEAAWNMVAARHLLPSYDQLLLDRTPKGWVNYLLATGSSVEKKKEARGALLILVGDLERKEQECSVTKSNQRMLLQP